MKDLYFSQIAQGLKRTLLNIRKQKNLTQDQLANKMDVGVVTIRRYEGLKLGKTLGLDFVFKLAEVSEQTPKNVLNSIFFIYLEEEKKIIGDTSSTEDIFKDIFSYPDSDILKFISEKKEKSSENIKNELLELISIYLASDRITQLEIFLDLSRKALSGLGDNHISLKEQNKIRDFVENKTKEWRNELKKQYN